MSKIVGVISDRKLRMKEAFAKFDADGDGSISAADFVKVMPQHGALRAAPPGSFMF